MNASNQSLNCNVPVKIVGWAADGKAKVEALVAFADIPMHSQIEASVVMEPMRKTQLDFDFFKKKGLRVGGIVTLRGANVEEPGKVACKAVNVLFPTPKHGAAFVLHGAAVHLRRPEAGGSTALVNQAIVAVKDEAVKVKSFTKALQAVKEGLDNCVLFGDAGLFLTGENVEGEVCEYFQVVERRQTVDEIIASMELKVGPEALAELKAAKSPWYLVPFFCVEIDPDPEIKGKASALAANRDFGSADEMSWLSSHVVLKAIGDDWFATDVSPVSENPVLPATLLDLVEGREPLRPEPPSPKP